MASPVLLLVLALLALAVLLLVVGVVVALLARDRRARREPTDMLRARAGAGPTPDAATVRGDGRDVRRRPGL